MSSAASLRDLGHGRALLQYEVGLDTVLERCGMRKVGVNRLAARLGDGTDVDLVGYDLLASELAERSA